MDDKAGNFAELGFTAGSELLKALKSADLSALFMTASDVVLVVNNENKIEDACFGDEELFNGGGRGWSGRPVLEVVTEESVRHLPFKRSISPYSTM